jgi:hypothetical protein
MLAKGVENQLPFRHSQSFFERMGGIESRGSRCREVGSDGSKGGIDRT